MNEIEEAQEIMYSIMKSFHLNEVGARICSIAYLSPESVSLEELAQKTKYSLASISNTVKPLFNCHILLKVKKPGTKKIFVKALSSPLDMLDEKTSLVLENEVLPIKEKFPDIIKRLEGNKKYEKELVLIKKKHFETLRLERIIKKIKIIIEDEK